MIKVRYIYSACIITETADVRILHDPWFTDGIYDGAWYQFPKLEDPAQIIGDVDYVYVSHIHPDHYDPAFLRHYFDIFGEKPIIIGHHKLNHLLNKMKVDGFAPIVIKDKMVIGKTSVTIVPHATGSNSDIDTAMVLQVEWDGVIHTLVNCNDVVMDADFRKRIKNEVNGKIDICFLGFTGAGPYPQTYYDANDPDLGQKSEKKKLEFFDRYLASIKDFNARVNVPFAGQYLLGGPLASMNGARGVADACEVLPLDPNAVVLEEGVGWIETENLTPYAARTAIFDAKQIGGRIKEITKNPLAYETDVPHKLVNKINLKQLLIAASKRAQRFSEVESDYYFCFKLSDNELAVINASIKAKEGEIFSLVTEDAELPTPRSEIDIDRRYLFGLLIRLYHWNNAEVGSLFATRRFPDIFNRAAQGYLNSFTAF